MMNSNYIICKLGANKKNAFVVDFQLKLELSQKIIIGNAKIDTGCEKTSISLQADSIGMRKQRAMELKQDAIDNNLNYTISFGVNDSKQFKDMQHKLVRDKKFMQCTVIKFDNPISNFTINGYSIHKDSIGVSYDRTSNVLIGMDILKDFDYHFGDSLVSDSDSNINKGDHIFIACLKTGLNEDYLTALKRYLGYIPDYKRLEFLIRNRNIQLESEFVERNYDKEQIGI